MNIKNAIVVFFVLMLLVFAGWYYFDKKDDKPLRTLPVFGPKTYGQTQDTIFHNVADFSFMNQYGNKVTQNDVKNDIYVTEFFFTTCKSICPIMNSNMVKIYKLFKNNPEFKILSHTVDPETDTVAQLLRYAEKLNVTGNTWWFLTGSKKELYEMARKSYLLNAEEGDGGEEDFIHTQNFALIDKERRIRGFYDGTDSLEIDRLIKDINVLIKEYEFKAKNKPD